jgi:hypothetical protein
MEGISIGLVFIVYGIIAGVSACGTTLLISTLMLLVSHWWPPLLRILSWQTVLLTFLISLILIFRGLISCNLVSCLL